MKFYNISGYGLSWSPSPIRACMHSTKRDLKTDASYKRGGPGAFKASIGAQFSTLPGDSHISL